MNWNENLENARNLAVGAAQSAAKKAKQLAAIAKANVAIYGEEEKVRKAERELGRLYYRDYAVGEEQDSAEYLPWCQKIDESKQVIAQLQEQIAQLRAEEDLSDDAPCACDADCVCDADCFCDADCADCADCAAPEVAPADTVEIDLNAADAPEA